MTALQAHILADAGPQAKTSRTKQIVLVFLISAIVLSPNFTILSGVYSPRGEDFVLGGILAFWFLALPVKRRVTDWLVSSRESVIFTRIMLGMIYVAGISIGVGTIAFQQTLILNDVMILPMIIRYGLIFLIGNLWVKGEAQRRIFLWALAGSLGVSALIGVLQHFNLAGINDWFTPLYVSDSMQVVGLELVKLGVPGGRVVGTHGDPRHYAFILVVGIGLCLSIFVNFRQGGIRRIAVVILGLCLMSIAFSASRTAILSGVIVFLAAIIFLLRKDKRISRVLGLLIVLLAVMALTSPAFESETFDERVLTLGTESYDVSLQARVRDLTTPFDQASESPIIWLTGRGPSKADLRTDSHNDFGWYFYRFGVPGLLLYLLLIMYGLKLSWRAWAYATDPVEKTMSMAAFLLVVNWAIFAMAENIFKDPQLMALNMLLIGVGIGSTRREVVNG